MFLIGYGPGDEPDENDNGDTPAGDAVNGDQAGQDEGGEGSPGDGGAPPPDDKTKAKTPEQVEAENVASLGDALRAAAPEGANPDKGKIGKKPTEPKKPEKASEGDDKDKKANEGAKDGKDGKPDDKAKPAGGDAAKDDQAGKDGKPDPAVEKEIKDLNIKDPKAQERFRSMAGGLKEKDAAIATLTTERDALRQDAEIGQQWIANVEATGSTPEEFGRSMSVLYALNSRDPALWEKALHAVQEVAGILAERLGIKTGNFDPLAHFADLTKQVKDGEISEAHALEIAQGRLRKKADDDRRAAEANDAQAGREAQQAQNDVARWAQGVAPNDPRFQEKLEFLKPQIRRIQANGNPRTWLQQIKDAYAEVERMFPAQATPPAPAGGGDGGKGGDKPAPRIGRVPGRSSGGGGGDTRPLAQDITDPQVGLRTAMAEALEAEKRSGGGRGA